MSYMNEIRNMRKSDIEAAIKQNELDRIKSKRRVDEWINSSIARKRALNQSYSGSSMFSWFSGKTAFYISILAVNLLFSYMFYQNMSASDPDDTSLYAKPSDFKRAEKFVNSFLRGNFSELAYFKPEISESLSKNAVNLLGKFNGVTVASVVVSEREDKGIVLKATCPKGEENAIIYLTPARKSFHVSGIEIENKYAMK